MKERVYCIFKIFIFIFSIVAAAFNRHSWLYAQFWNAKWHMCTNETEGSLYFFYIFIFIFSIVAAAFARRLAFYFWIFSPLPPWVSYSTVKLSALGVEPSALQQSLVKSH